MTKYFYLFLLFLATSFSLRAQQGTWDAYIAQYNGYAGSTTLNMDLINTAPDTTLGFIVITGVTFTNCSKEGFPMKEEFENLYKISDDVIAVATKTGKMEYAGSFTSKCQRLDYIYVKDTSDIRIQLVALYETKYKSYKYYINIKPDTSWDAYRKFLYPNEETREYMSNSKVLEKLTEAGDQLEKPRPVDHWLYFPSKEDRDAFIKYSKIKGFKIVETVLTSDPKFPYQLHISKVDLVDIRSICKITLELRRKAKELKGFYDGWETVLIK
jgi:hypothetical protein